jgi:hypothetical protein
VNGVRALVAALLPTMAARGFGWQARHEWFRRRVGGVQHVLQLLSVDHPPAVDIEPQLMVRHDLVERIFHRTSGYPPENQPDTPTVGGDLHQLVAGAPTRFVLVADGDARAAAQWLTGALPRLEEYWARFSALPEIDRDLNDDPRRHPPNRPLPWLRCSTGLIVARLVQRPDYDQLEAEYRRQLAIDNNGFYLGRFAALADDLRRHTPAQLREL